MEELHHFGFIHHIGPFELVIILVVVLLLFGAKRLPELARGLGKSMSEFKKATQEVQDDFRSAVDNVDPRKTDDAARDSVKADSAQTKEPTTEKESPRSGS